MEYKPSDIIKILKDIFNKGLKNGIYDVDDANSFLNAIKNLENLLERNEKKFIDPIDYIDNIV